MQIQVKYHHPDLYRISKFDKGDWIDLRAAENVKLNAGEDVLISLGISIKLPKEYEMWLAPRSSTYRKYHIIQTNGIGIIDNTYCGNNDIIRMPVLAMKDTIIPFNERIAQFRLVPRMKYADPNFINGISFDEVEDLQTEDRGGFGSTGRI